MPESRFGILSRAVYLYTAEIPAGCKGHRYRVLAFIRQEPVKQQLVLVRCLSGPDRGLLFACTPSNFLQRYELLKVKQPEPAPVPPVMFDPKLKVAGKPSQGSGA